MEHMQHFVPTNLYGTAGILALLCTVLTREYYS